MEKHVVKVLGVDVLTHNVKRLTVEKPDGYEYTPGQCTDVAINKPEWTDELRPFTFTSLPDEDHLEFIIKMYRGHNGMTEQLANVVPGDELLIHEVFGTIAYQGPGVFIAGGAGITPFIAIFRHLKRLGQLDGNTLLFANNTLDDIILKEELKAHLGDHYVDVIRNAPAGFLKTLIDKELLAACINDATKHFYICGPDQFTKDMIGLLQELGIEDEQIIFEQ
jgi:ferredoxin-NADP reductase